jgi:hypothetical protein
VDLVASAEGFDTVFFGDVDGLGGGWNVAAFVRLKGADFLLKVKLSSISITRQAG